MLKAPIAAALSVLVASSALATLIAQPANRPPVRAGKDVPPPEKTKHVDPVYPEAARAAGASGTVIVEFVVDEAGRVTNPRVLRSVPQLDEAALAAVRQWLYRPPRPNGTPGSIIMMVPLQFKPLPAGTYSTAPRITNRDFLTRVRQVELEIVLQPLVLEYITAAQFEAVVREALADNGIAVVPTATVRAVAEMRMIQPEFVTTRTVGSRVTDVRRTPLLTTLLDLRFELTTPVLHGERFAPMRVAPAATWSFSTNDDVRWRNSPGQELRADLDTILNSLKATSGIQVESPARSDSLDAAFARAYATGSQVEGPLTNVSADYSLDVYLQGEANRYHDLDSVRAAWAARLSSLGVNLRASGPREMRVALGALFHNSGPGAIQLLVPAMERSYGQPYYAHVDHVSIREKDVVFNLDGTFVRKSARLWWDSSFGTSEPPDTKATADRMVADRLSGIGGLFARRP